MKVVFRRNIIIVVLLTITCGSFTSCLTAKNLDKFVANEYNNELPRTRKTKAQLDVTPSSSSSPVISTTVHKTDKFLPLLIYWKMDHHYTCTLNPAIATTNFSNALNSAATKPLMDKLQGKTLQLTVEEAPAAFSIVAKENLVWLILYAVTWAKIYIEPDMKDLVVSYKMLEAGNVVKTGSITVKNTSKNQGLRFFQSWRSATSEQLSDYNANCIAMTKAFVKSLTEEL